MLVLSRKHGEQVVIGEGIVVTVTELNGGTVKLGIQAPRTLSIRRGGRAADHDVASFLSQWREADQAKSLSGTDADIESPGTHSAGSARETTSSNIRRKLLRRLSRVPR
jgi:hypothetical protein